MQYIRGDWQPKVGEKPPCSALNCKKEGVGSCGKCRIAYYCGDDCLLSDWKEHKKICGTKEQIPHWFAIKNHSSVDGKNHKKKSNSHPIVKKCVRRIEVIGSIIKSHYFSNKWVECVNILMCCESSTLVNINDKATAIIVYIVTRIPKVLEKIWKSEPIVTLAFVLIGVDNDPRQSICEFFYSDDETGVASRYYEGKDRGRKGCYSISQLVDGKELFIPVPDPSPLYVPIDCVTTDILGLPSKLIDARNKLK